MVSEPLPSYVRPPVKRCCRYCMSFFFGVCDEHGEIPEHFIDQVNDCALWKDALNDR